MEGLCAMVLNEGGLFAYRYPDQGWMRLDPDLVVGAPEAEAADDAGHDELRGQDGIHYNTQCQSVVIAIHPSRRRIAMRLRRVARASALGSLSNERLTFANELVADVDGGLGDGAAELEVIGNVVLAAPRRTAEDAGDGRRLLLLVLVRRGRLRPGALFGILRRRRGVLGVGGHGGSLSLSRRIAIPVGLLIV